MIMDIGDGSVGNEDAKLQRKEFARRAHQVHSVLLSQDSSQATMGERWKGLSGPEDLPGGWVTCWFLSRGSMHSASISRMSAKETTKFPKWVRFTGLPKELSFGLALQVRIVLRLCFSSPVSAVATLLTKDPLVFWPH
jgi:hypothetical protein